MRKFLITCAVLVTLSFLAGCGGAPKVRKPAPGATILKMATTTPDGLSFYPPRKAVSEKIGAATEEKLFFEVLITQQPGAPSVYVKSVGGSGGFDALWTPAYMVAGDSKVFPLFSRHPFSKVDYKEFYDWLTTDAKLYYDAAYKRLNVKAIPCGALGPDGFWSRSPIQSVSDLKKMKVRSAGFELTTFERAGAQTRPLNGGQTIKAMKGKSIDALEILTPADDYLYFGNPDIEWGLYYPGPHSNLTMIDLLINLDLWNGLSAGDQAVVEQACQANVMESYESAIGKDRMQVNRWKSRGIKVQPFSAEVTDELRTHWHEYGKDLIEFDNDEDFNKVFNSYLKRFGAR